MDYVCLGRSGLRVSRICLGTMDFGGATDEMTAQRIIEAAREAKINFADTADVYADGASERTLGKLIAKDRHQWVVATKVGQQDGPPHNKMGLSRRWMRHAIDASLKRLGTDYVDIYYMHHHDPDTPLVESIEAMRDIIASGKATYWGFSNHYAWEIGEIVRLCDKTGAPRPVVAQPMYNIVMRMAENDYLPACEHYGIGVASFSPLARGALSGKYKEGALPPADSRAARGDNSLLTRDLSSETFKVVEALRAYVVQRGMTLPEFAELWVLNNRLISSVIVGPRTLEQWNSYLGAFNHKFTAADESFVDNLVAQGHAAEQGFIWKRYPPTGRKPLASS
jgi:aryl-alcohol dehydrogenase-like predicted oxidoreductase